MAVAMTGVMVVSVLAIVVVLNSVLVAEADGECSCNQPCPNSGHCCSKFGYCGEGNEYCGDGCQAGPCSGGGGTCEGKCSCNQPCPNSGHCCSSHGYCGEGIEYCGDGCQAGPCSGGGTCDRECSRNQPCPNSAHCCNRSGHCGEGNDYCGDGCQAGPCSGGGTCDGGLGAILTRDLYEEFFQGHLEFYSYDVLIESAKAFPEFGCTGDETIRKREIAAYAAHVTHETSGLKEVNESTGADPGSYCRPSTEFPCNGYYFGRGPLQLSWNYNYGACGNYIRVDLLNNPDLVGTNNSISFTSSLWFWNKYGDAVIPHIHDVITGKWQPNEQDELANRKPGFGVTINIINGGLECNKESAEANRRVKLFEDFCRRLNVPPGPNLDCKNMRPFYGVSAVAES